MEVVVNSWSYKTCKASVKMSPPTNQHYWCYYVVRLQLWPDCLLSTHQRLSVRVVDMFWPQAEELGHTLIIADVLCIYFLTVVMVLFCSFSALTLVGDRKNILPAKDLAPASPKGSLEVLWGPGLTWRNMWKNMLVRQKSKAAVVAVSVLLLMLPPIFISAKEVMFSLCLFVCYQDCAEKN